MNKMIQIQEIYEEIEDLANKIGGLGLPEKYIKAAKNLEPEKGHDILQEDYEKFMEKTDPKLKKRLEQLFEKYQEVGSPNIFGKGLIPYNQTKINPMNLCFIFIFSEGDMNEVLLFKDFKEFSSSLKNKGYEKFAEYEEGLFSLCSFESLIEVVNMPNTIKPYNN